MYSFGVIAYLAAIGVFVYFTYTSYQGAISTAYISLTDSGDDTCNSVPISITGKLLFLANLIPFTHLCCSLFVITILLQGVI